MMNLNGQRIVVTGAANAQSICWAIAQQVSRCGGDVILTAQPRAVERVKRLASQEMIEHVYPCDYFSATDPNNVDRCFEELAKLGHIEGFVHGIASTGEEGLRKSYSETSLANFQQTMSISCWTFIDMTRRMRSLMTKGGSMVTLSFDASQGIYDGYGIMATAKAALESSVMSLAYEFGPAGIRVNGISPSPEKTVSAMGVPGYRAVGAAAEMMSLLGGRADPVQIGNLAVFLLSPMAQDITAQIIRIDRGASAARMPLAMNVDKASPDKDLKLGDYLLKQLRAPKQNEGE